MSRSFLRLAFIIVMTTSAAQGLRAEGPADGKVGLPESAYRPTAEYQGDLGPYRSPLIFDDGRPVEDAAGWRERRKEILRAWHELMGPWPALIEAPRFEVLDSEREENYERRQVRLEVAPGRMTDGYLLVPDGEGRRPAVLVVFYEPESSIGRSEKPGRDFGRQLSRQGFVTLSIGIDPRGILTEEAGALGLQPLSYLAYWAANAGTALASQPEVDPKRIGVMGHSYGGKWAMFAACLDERFACGVWSDPGVAFDEARPNVNYWMPWYLGWEPDRTRGRGLPSEANPRTGAYAKLVDAGRDLHEFQALMAPRPFLVSGGAEDGPDRWKALNHVVAVNKLLGAENRVAMTFRPEHSPSPESNAQIVAFLADVLSLEPAPAASKAP